MNLKQKFTKMTELIIGRQDEQKKLKLLFQRSTPDFIAVYGRQRVGKTYLIRNYFQKQTCLYFEATGIKDASQAQQIKLFVEKISEVFYEGLPLEVPQNWLDAFKLLTEAIMKSLAHTPLKGKALKKSLTEKASQKIVLFIDELPWFATPKSGFIQALDYYWNTKWSTIPHFKLIVCGSAASWMLNTLIRAKGGLHNRLTDILPLRPFMLKETREYLLYKGMALSLKQIVDLYMVIGGIPHYLNALDPGCSVSQNLNRMCFQKNGLLFQEFKNLFASLFDSSEAHNELIRIIAKSRQGISREEILEKAKLSSSGGLFAQRLEELEEAGFIASFTPLGNKKKGTFFRVIDEYVFFYLKWIEPVTKRISLSLENESYWESKMQSQPWKIWAGYAFESVCFKHIRQIKKALGLSVVACDIGSWREISKNNSQEDNHKGCQIDLMIDRSDGIINLCEIKYHQGQFVFTKKDVNEITQKISVYQRHSGTTKPIHVTLITPEGGYPNDHAKTMVRNEVTLPDLFT
jgi:predicted AAA+ superfamily ATPase